MNTRLLALSWALVMLVGAGCAAQGTRRSGAASAADPESLRSTTEGRVLGVAGSDASHAWLGIAYAQPPIGELRWRRPRAPTRHDGVALALKVGSACSQHASPIGVSGPAGSVVGSEDCLYLNVWAPRFGPAQVPRGDERLPVMVWIHGGGNVMGSGELTVGSRLASSQGVVVVTLNYRLGPLGWFRHPALRSGETDARDASGNYGTLDILQALAWIRENVSDFGGDPERVTVFGESSGGVNVFSLLVSPLARGLFQRAIVQSGGPLSVSVAEAENRLDDEPAGRPGSSGEIVLRLLLRSGRARERSEAVELVRRMDPAEIAALLRATDPAELIDVYPRTVEPFIDVPVVIRDGHVLPEESLEKLLHSSQRVARVPLLMGTNRDETRVLQLAAGVEIRSLFGLFPRVKDAERYARLAYYTSGLWKAAGADEIAAAQVRSGARDVWVYRFDWDEQPSSWLGDLPLLMGASHAMEVPFVFGRFELGPLTKLIFDEANEPGRLALSDTMMSYWAQFAATGDPARGRNGSLPRWERWSEATVDAPRFLILYTPAGGGPHMSSDSLTQSELLAQLVHDPLLSKELRCDLLEQIQNNPMTPKIDLASAGCADEDRASARTP